MGLYGRGPCFVVEPSEEADGVGPNAEGEQRSSWLMSTGSAKSEGLEVLPLVGSRIDWLILRLSSSIFLDIASNLQSLEEPQHGLVGGWLTCSYLL